MRYPLYFPFPSCWLKALILTVSLIPLTIFFRLFGKSTLYALVIFSERSGWQFLTWFAIVGCIVPIFILGHIYQFLWGEPPRKLPKWIPSPKSWVEGLWMWIVGIIAIAIPVLGFLAWHDFNPPYPLSDREGQILTIAFLVVSAYLYHVRVLVKRIFSQKSI
ncbi:MAG: hypothetical protein ACRC2R_17900 [Xenococcaceae cyanobacterium]